MSLKEAPFNIWLFKPDSKMVAMMRPVTVLDTFDASRATYHPDGLFSTEIFGQVGSEERDRKFSYINLKTTILHPEIVITLRQLKGLYGGIMSGKRYAIWDEEEKDFFPSNSAEGSTGYQFFVSKLKDIVFKRNKSDIRNLRIDVVEKYRDMGMMDRHLVMPAGLRDIYVDNTTGQHSEDEINDLYRRLIATSNTIAAIEENRSSPALDAARWSLQMTAVQIYLMIKGLLSGKRGWIQKKYASRKTRNGTRNVITSMGTNAFMLGAANAVSVVNTEIGLLQTMRGALPITIHCLRNSIIGETFSEGNSEVWLMNPKTYQRELVKVDTDTLDFYSTKAGMEKFINQFFIRELRNKPIEIDGYYLGLLYDDGKNFKIVKDIEELPEGYSRKVDGKTLSPLTLADVLYLSCYQRFKKLVGTVTRYPIATDGSIYPTIFKVRTTTTSSMRLPLDDDWQPMSEEYICPAFHERSPDARWLDSLVPHITRLAALGADFDGDQCSSPIAYTEEVYNEISNYFKKRTSFVAADGGLVTSTGVDTVNLLLSNMTGYPED